MKITSLELPVRDLQAQHEYYTQVLGLSANLATERIEVQAGTTKLIFTQASSNFVGAYHFAFNIPENQFDEAKAWISNRIPLLHDESGKDEFDFVSWNSNSVYFKDTAGNVLEFIARHNLKNGVSGGFDSGQILNISEIGLPSEEVVTFANELCARLGLSVFKQGPDATFTPVGDDNGLFILPVKDRIWFPNSGVPAQLMPVRVAGEADGVAWEVRGVPYEILVGAGA